MKKPAEQTRTTVTAAVGAAAAILVLTVGLWLALRWDLPLSQRLMPLWQDGQAKHSIGVFSPWYVWAVCADTLAAVPSWSVLVFGGWVFFADGGHGGKGALTKMIIGAVLALGGGVTISCIVFGKLAAHEAVRLPVVLRVLIGLLCGAAVLAQPLLRDNTADRLTRGKTLTALWGTFTVAHLLIVNVIKPIWGRLRFDDMIAAGRLAEFTPWTQPAGAGGSSFPSGHTAAAGMLLAMVFCCRLYGFARKDVGGWLFAGYLWMLAVGFGRILVGRHFLSDVLAAAWIDSLLLFILVLLQPWAERRFGVQPPQETVPGDSTVPDNV